MNKFPLHCFPKPVADYIKGVAFSSTTNESFVGLGVVAACNVLSAGSQLEVKYGYRILPNMYMCVVAQKGYSKSNSLNAPLSHLLKYEHKKWSDYEKERERLERIAASVKASERSVVMQELPEAPMTSIVSKATTEGLKARLADNEKNGYPAFSLFKVDELNGFFGSMDMYNSGKGDACEFYLEAFDGAFLNETLKSGRLVVEDVHVSVIGSIQPEIFKKAFDSKNQSNGLFDRFMFAIDTRFPEQSDPLADLENSVNVNYLDWMDSILSKKRCIEYKLDNDHRVLFKQFCVWTHKKGQQHGTGAFKKWETNCLKLIVNLHILWKKPVIDLDTMQLAIDLMKFYVTDWIKGLTLAEESDDAVLERELIELIKQKKVLTKYQLMRKAKFKNDHQGTDKALEAMISRGDILAENSNGKGRPTITYSWAEDFEKDLF